MAQIKLVHEFSDQNIFDNSLTGVNGEPDCVDLKVNAPEISLTKSDIIALARSVNVKGEDL